MMVTCTQDRCKDKDSQLFSPALPGPPSSAEMLHIVTLLHIVTAMIRMLLKGTTTTKNLSSWALPKQGFNSPFYADIAICGIYFYADFNKSHKTVISTMLMDILPMTMVKNVLCVLF